MTISLTQEGNEAWDGLGLDYPHRGLSDLFKCSVASYEGCRGCSGTQLFSICYEKTQVAAGVVVVTSMSSVRAGGNLNLCV